VSARRAFAAVLVAVALVSATACGSSKPKAVPLPVRVDERGKQQILVDARLNQFTPADVIVDVGTRVTWRNTDTIAHNVKKAADVLDFHGVFGADASVFGPGQSYSFTFTKPGAYAYTCTIHTLMGGKVEVVAK
jgi:plastocyanin